MDEECWAIRDTTWDFHRTHETGENWKVYERREREEGFARGGKEDPSRSVYYNRGVIARNAVDDEEEWEISRRQLKG